MSNLSPFHAELLDFLRKRELRETLPLAEIVDHYYRLFDANGSMHVERKLLDTFSKGEFAALGLERQFPRMYRGLPRLYQRDQPAHCYIKKNFTHLPTLIRLAVEKAVTHLYGHLELPKGAKIAVLTWVMSDGWGDFRAAEQMVARLQRRFAGVHLDWVALVPEGYAISMETTPTHLIRYRDECPIERFPAKALEALAAADLVLQFPTYYPHTADLMKRVRGRFHSIGEYGFLESSWFHPRTGNRSMGLHFLEKGILIPDRVEKELIDLENRQLLQWLFGKFRPTAAREKKYLADNHFYLAYLSTLPGAVVYLHALFHSLEEDEKNVDLCMPDLRWLTQPERPILQRGFGIRAIEIYFGEKVYSLKIQKKGKRVRIFSPEALSHADFQILLRKSGPFAAVRGNQSFSEAVAADQVFFYDGREHVRYFMKDLLAVAENRIGAYPQALACFRGMGKTFLHNLPEEKGEWVDESYFQEKEPLLEIALAIGSALKSGGALAGFQKFNAILREEYPFEEFLYPWILRELCHAKRPDIAQYEETHLELFLRGSCSFSVLVSAIRRSIKYPM